MIPSYTRTKILESLHSTISARRPILGAGASAGLIARCAELAGTDLIIVYSTGKSRLMGLPTSWLGDSNKITLGMFEEMNNVLQKTPIVGGVEASDPTHMDLGYLLKKFRDVGYSGVINFPTVGVMPERSKQREDVGLGYSRDIKLISIAREQDIFSMAYVFDADQSAAMARAGADCIVAHVGWTAGGLVGAKGSAMTLEDAQRKTKKIFEAALEVNSRVICLLHGGQIVTPEDTRIMYSATGAQGFVGASSIERIPVEDAVQRIVREFKAVPLS
jgi:predicted TIM-barrel enzyme